MEDSADIPPPLDEDGVRTVTLGTVLFAVAALVTPFLAGREVALTCLAGFLLGLVGVRYCARRRDAIARDAALGIPRRD